jgi:hypothetical protein
VSGPQTEAGRALIASDALYGQGTPIVLAIEREAVAAFLASPEAAEGLANVLRYEIHIDEAHGFPPGYGPKHLAEALLAAWQQELAASTTEDECDCYCHTKDEGCYRCAEQFHSKPQFPDHADMSVDEER